MTEITFHFPKVGESYKKGKLTRTVEQVEGYEIKYRNQNGKIGACWLTTWHEWIRKAERIN